MLMVVPPYVYKNYNFLTGSTARSGAMHLRERFPPIDYLGQPDRAIA